MRLLSGYLSRYFKPRNVLMICMGRVPICDEMICMGWVPTCDEMICFYKFRNYEERL